MEPVLEIFYKKKILSAEQLIKLLKCSIRTVQRRLNIWGAYRSYNKNGRYYVLPDTAKFNENGIWQYNNVFFSKYGNLRKTVISLISISEKGLSASEIGNHTGLSAHTFLHHFRELPAVKREKHGGRFVYFSGDSQVYAIQLQKLVSFQNSTIFLPPDADAVIILIQMLKHPNISIEELLHKVTKTGRNIDIGILKYFLNHHGLQKKTVGMQP